MTVSEYATKFSGSCIYEMQKLLVKPVFVVNELTRKGWSPSRNWCWLINIILN